MAKPFAHDDLPLKQHFLGLARDFMNRQDSLENELAAALLYMNLADYLAEYLVTGMTELAKEAMNKYYLGMVSVIPQQRDSFNIGNAIFVLRGFDFPKKAQIMTELEAINKARKKIAHEIVKTKGDELLVIDEAVKQLGDHTESLVILVDEIDPGMPPTNLIDKLQALNIDMPKEQDKTSNEPQKIRKPKPAPKKRKSHTK